MSKKIRIKREKVALTTEQIKDVLNTIDSINNKYRYRNKLMAKLWFSTGLRVAEMANLQVNWMLKASACFIFVKKNDKPFAFKPKYGSSRKIPIDGSLYDDLVRYVGSRTTGYVFYPQSKKQYARFHDKSLINLFNWYFRRTPSIARNLGSHAFRRTFASQLNSSNVPLDKISEYLGHSDIGTTVGYLYNMKLDQHDEIINSEYFKKLKKW